MTPFTVPDDGLVIPAAIAELPTPAKEIRLHKGLVVQDRTLRFTKIGKIIDYDKMYIRVQYEGEDTTTRIYRRLWKRRLTVIPKTTIATKAAIPTLPAIKPIVGMPVIITAAFDDYDDAIGKTATIEKNCWRYSTASFYCRS
jgi:hypothetical protein